MFYSSTFQSEMELIKRKLSITFKNDEGCESIAFKNIVNIANVLNMVVGIQPFWQHFQVIYTLADLNKLIIAREGSGLDGEGLHKQTLLMKTDLID